MSYNFKCRKNTVYGLTIHSPVWKSKNVSGQMVLSRPPWPIFLINFSLIRLGNVNNCVTRAVTLNTQNVILVPRADDPSELWLGSRALAGPNFLSMRRLFLSYSQPIRFARFDGYYLSHAKKWSDFLFLNCFLDMSFRFYFPMFSQMLTAIVEEWKSCCFRFRFVLQSQ